MEEKHKNEQYFFDSKTLQELTDFVAGWSKICCICCPMLGKSLAESGSDVSILDIDERFSDLPGFQRYDILEPKWLDKKFDIIICDPPFYNVSLYQLNYALRMLSQHDYSQPLMVSYLKRREKAVFRSFSDFNLEPTGYFPRYETVNECSRNEIEFFSNVQIVDML